MRVEIIHNPFTIKSTIEIDGEIRKEAWFENLAITNNIPNRLSAFARPLAKEILKRFRTDKLYFAGTRFDFDELKSELQRLDEDVVLYKDYDRMVVEDNVHQKLIDLLSKLKESPIEKFQNLEFTESLKAISDRELVVTVMAPMKNGKSTFINSILGVDLLPTARGRCTAKITEIKDRNKNADSGFQAYAITTNGEKSKIIFATKELLSEWNKDNNIKQVCLLGRIPYIDIEEKNSLRIVDTPGPDSATHIEDRIVVDEYIKDKSLPMVCFVLEHLNDTTQEYLKKIRKKLNTDGQQAEDRVLFILSKIDSLDNDMEIENISFSENPLKEYLDEQRKGLENLGFKNPKIFPVSAIRALDIRGTRDLSKLTSTKRDNLEIFRNLFYVKLGNKGIFEYSSISESTKDIIRKKLEEAIKNDNNKEVFSILSGISAVEESIKEYLFKHLIPSRIYDTCKKIDNEISALNIKGKLLKKISDNNGRIEDIEKSILDIHKRLGTNSRLKELINDFRAKGFIMPSRLKSDLADFSTQIRHVEEKARDELRENSDTNRVPREVAERIMENYRKNLQNTLYESTTLIKHSIEEYINKERYIIIKEYEDIISSIVSNGSKFFTKEIGKIVTNITKEELYDIPSSEFPSIKRKSRDITWKEDKWYEWIWAHGLPFTSIVKNEEYYDKGQIISYLSETDKIRQVYEDNVKDSVKKQYNTLKDRTLLAFEKIERNIEQFLNQEAKLIRDKNLLIEEKEKFERLKTWVDNFESKKNEILEI